MFVAMFFVVYGMAGNAIGHIAYCIMVKGYFPGIYTSFLNLLLAPVLIKHLWPITQKQLPSAQRSFLTALLANYFYITIQF